MSRVVHETGREIDHANSHGREVVGGTDRDYVYKTACGSWVDDVCQVVLTGYNREAYELEVAEGFATWCRRPGCRSARP